MTGNPAVGKEKRPSLPSKEAKDAKKKKEKKPEKKHAVQMSLRVNLTQKETISFSQSLARANQDLAGEENEKKEVMSSFANKITMLKTNIFDLSKKISNGYEYRGVDVDVFFDYRKGIKIYVRRDTKEVVEEKPMTDHDRQQEFPFKDKKKKEAEKKEEKKVEKKTVDTIDKKKESNKKDEKPAEKKKGKKDGWGNEK